MKVRRSVIEKVMCLKKSNMLTMSVFVMEVGSIRFFFLLSYFGIITDSQEVAKIVQRDSMYFPSFPNGDISCNYSAFSKTGH